VLATVLLPSLTAQAAGREVSFNRDVLPILAANCLSCHGFDAHGRQAGLRLDTAEGATATLDSGAQAVVPGDAAASELEQRTRQRGRPARESQRRGLAAQDERAAC
jgi:hypothetical protein